MIYLTTGANGAGKTLLTLKDVREQQLKENRPVYYHGFDMDESKAAEFGWQKFDPKQWQDLPDGSICVMDECQNEFPLRRSGSEVPDYVNAIAQHRRRRGFDFWLICPHPSLLDVFIRRLIDKPSWHRHLKRAFGADMVSVLRFSAPDMKCEDPGSGARGEVAMRAYPKDVYSWYRSASLHTGKKKIPRAVYVVVAAALIVPAGLYYAVTSVKSNMVKASPPADTKSVGAVVDGINPRPDAQLVKISADDYITLRKSRIPDFPHTAPVFDDVTRPAHAPYPAACVHMGKVCNCYTQQGTLLAVSGEVCLQIVKQGFFIEWNLPQEKQQRQQWVKHEPVQQQQQQRQQQHEREPMKESQQAISQWEQGLMARNAQVRSSLKQ
ncbi:MAG: hypothetical protein JSS77_16255 [Acidobacteria bacterium]|nr:hypothetical protein [Acidobacteriota bacterium]